VRVSGLDEPVEAQIGRRICRSHDKLSPPTPTPTLPPTGFLRT
jgi:hypothetical protein